jgi:hypothetical protein
VNDIEVIDVDTIIVVDSTGYDETFTKSAHPGMLAYIIPGDRPGKATYKVEIPIEWVPIPQGE